MGFVVCLLLAGGACAAFGQLRGEDLEALDRKRPLALRDAQARNPPQWSATAALSWLPPVENTYWSHWVGHQTEVRVASEMADQGQLVVRWGDKVGTTGSDIIAVKPVTGEVTLADTKFSSASKSLKMSDTFNFSGSTGLDQYEKLKTQAIRAIQESTIDPSLKAKAVANVQAGNFNANTIGAGNYRNSVPMRFCSGKPC